MTVEQQARIARALRAWTGLPQDEMAAKAGIGEKTLLELERGRACSEQTWAKLLTAYEAMGLSWRDGSPGIIVIAE